MITIPMNSKGAVSRDSLLSINRSRIQDCKTSQTIRTLNQGYPRGSTPISSPVHTGTSSVPPVHTGTPSASPVHTGTPSAPPVHTGTPSASPAAPNTAHPFNRQQIPKLQKTVQKGQKVSIGSGTPPDAIKVCFGWNTLNPACDVDVSAFLLGNNGKVLGDSWFVFYGQTESPDHSTQFLVDDSADREVIKISFNKLNPDVKKIVFVLTINEAFEKKLHFGMLKEAYVRIISEKTGAELVSFQMTDYYSNVISMMPAEIYQHKGIWKFNAIGNGVARDLAGLCALYGVQVGD